jgi:arylsulfatase A-like enzyme
MHCSRARAAGRPLVIVLLLSAALAACGPPATRFDTVVLVTIDTLRADHLGSYGYPRPVTPFLDSLAASGLRFTHAYSSMSHTAPAHASMLTALHPAQHQVLANGMDLDRSIPSLAGILGAKGFDTAAFVSVRFLGAIGADFDHFDRNFDRPHRAGDQTVAAATRWLAERESDQRLLLWVHLYDPHEYDNDDAIEPERLRAMEEDFEERRSSLVDVLAPMHGWSATPRPEQVARLNRYDSQITLADDALAALHRAIGDRDPQRRTLWVVTADHGEALGDHGYVGHGKNLYREQMQVPLIVASPAGWWQPGTIDAMARHVDLLPTIADLLGVDVDAERLRLEGTSLAPLFDDRDAAPPVAHVFYQRRPVDEIRRRDGWEPGMVAAIQTPSAKYIFRSEGEHEFYDLVSDPHELENRIHTDSPEKERTYRTFARELRRLTADHRIELQGQHIDPSYIDDLKALGYL